MSEKKTPPPQKSKPRRRRRRLMRWLFFIGLILSLLIGIVQGPVLRKIATDLIRKELDAAGMTGSFIVEGSLFSGLELRAVHLTSHSYIQELHADRLRVDYKLTELINGNIDEIAGEGIDIWIELSPPPTAAQAPVAENTSDATPTATTATTEINLEEIRQKILPIKFLLNDCSVGISREKKWLWRAEKISLTHRVGAEDCYLSLGRFVDMDDVELENQEAILTWSENFTSLKNFPIRAKAILSHLRCRWDQTTPEHLEALINWQQGLFTFQLDDLKKAQIELSSGEIDLDSITPWIGLEGKMGGKVTALQASVTDIMATPDTMDAHLEIEGQAFYWMDHKISHLQINTTVKNGQINLTNNTSLTPNGTVEIKATGQLVAEASTDWLTCWHGAKAQFEVNIPQPEEIARWSKLPPPTGGWPNGAIHLSGDTHLIESELEGIKAQLLWNSPTWAQLQWEQLTVQASWNQASQKATAELKLIEPQGATITAQGHYSIDSEQYQGALSVQSLDIATLHPALDLFEITTPRTGNINLNWSGQGRGADFASYQGKLDTAIKRLDIQGEGQPPIDITIQGDYAENLEVNIGKIQLDRNNLHLHSAGSWKDKQLHLTQLELLDNELRLIKGQATMPLSNEANNLDAFLKQAEELDIGFHVKDLPIAEIYEELPESVEQKVRGTLSLDLIVKGTLLEPKIQLQTEVKRIQVIGQKDVPAANISLKVSAQNNAATLDANIKPDGYKAISLKGKMPFNPKAWIDDPSALMTEPIDIALDTPSIDLAPFSKFIPHISKIDGSFTASAQVTGTIDKPIITGKSRLKVSRVDSMKESIPDLRDLNIGINYDHEKLTIEPSSCLVAGGKYNLKGTIGMEEVSNPLFDISLTADKALIWRDESIIVRADANLSLKGPYEKAHLQGEIGIVESLFYKDIQIIPIGGGGSSTSTQPEQVELPKFTQPNNKDSGEATIPAPFDQWTLALRIRTKDDLLIRGNIAKGNVSGDLSIQGTFKDPLPTGQVTLNNAQASLPFSRLHVKEGKVIFSPQHGFDPQISIKATSKIGPNNVNIKLYGRASSPKTLMTSSPPLPENEIIFLLATGSTSDELNDGGAVTGKAYQLLVDSMLRSSPGKFRKLKKMLTELNQKVNVNIGASDPFTGRKYNSASVELHERWYVIASADLDNHTRGLLVYAIRFK